jgi:hypothetical protein
VVAEREPKDMKSCKIMVKSEILLRGRCLPSLSSNCRAARHFEGSAEGRWNCGIL